MLSAPSPATKRIDIGHGQELFEVIDTLPLRPDHEAMIGVSAFHTVAAIIEVLDEVSAAVAGVPVTGGTRVAGARVGGAQVGGARVAGTQVGGTRVGEVPVGVE